MTLCLLIVGFPHSKWYVWHEICCDQIFIHLKSVVSKVLMSWWGSLHEWTHLTGNVKELMNWWFVNYDEYLCFSNCISNSIHETYSFGSHRLYLVEQITFKPIHIMIPVCELLLAHSKKSTIHGHERSVPCIQSNYPLIILTASSINKKLKSCKPI